MLPRLQAEDTVQQINALAVGSGTMQDDARRSFLRELNTQLGVRAMRPTVAQLKAEGLDVQVGDEPDVSGSTRH